MSKRLQVILEDSEMQRLKKAAAELHISVGELVRQALRRDLGAVSTKPREDKLKLLQRSLTFRFPAGDIDEMNKEIAGGHVNGLP